MKVFISSVRQGLETERDALPALIRALGHEPLRFEDFTAQSVPSREACLSAVQSADVYLLLLGPFYGTRFPETGHSPTQEEHNAAQAKGIPRLVFRKTGIDFEPDQAAFVKEIEEYGTGLFRKSFSDAVDLLAKVAAMLRELPRRGCCSGFHWTGWSTWNGAQIGHEPDRSPKPQVQFWKCMRSLWRTSDGPPGSCGTSLTSCAVGSDLLALCPQPPPLTVGATRPPLGQVLSRTSGSAGVGIKSGRPPCSEFGWASLANALCGNGFRRIGWAPCSMPMISAKGSLECFDCSGAWHHQTEVPMPSGRLLRPPAWSASVRSPRWGSEQALR